MLKLQLLAILGRVESGLPKHYLRTEHKVLHGAVGDTEFADALQALKRDALISIKRHGVTNDEICSLTKKGRAALDD